MAERNDTGTLHRHADQVLGMLARGEPMGESQIASELPIEATQVSGLMTDLQRDGHVTRTHGGRWALTPAARSTTAPVPGPREPGQPSQQGHRVGMLLDASGPSGAEAVERLRSALGGATVGEPDATGSFEVTVPAASFDEALDTVWNAVAASGLDDRLRFAEHRDMPEHWRARGG